MVATQEGEESSGDDGDEVEEGEGDAVTVRRVFSSFSDEAY